MKAQLGVGVVGLGEFGERHLSAYRGLPGVEIVGVCSRSRERAEEIAHKYGAKRWYTDLRQFMGDGEIDVVSVVTAEGRHLEPVLSAIEAGKHVLVEKPIATNIDEAKQMVAACSQADVFVMPGHIMRFESRYALVKEEIERGTLGGVATMFARRNVSKKFDLATGERAHPAFRVAVHDIDLALWYIGDRVKRIYAVERNTQGRDHPDILWALLQFAGGAVVCIESNMILPPGSGVRSETVTEIIGTEGSVKIGPATDGLVLQTTQGQFSPNVRWWPVVHGSMGGALRNEITYFVKCVMEGVKPSVVSMEEALETVRIAAAIVQSAQSQQEVCL